MASNPPLRLRDGDKPTKALKTSFTIKMLEAIRVPKRGRTEIYDVKQRNLTYRVTSNNARSFYFYGKHKGKPLRVKLGDADIMTIAQARDKAAEVRRDPNAFLAERRAERIELTIGNAHNHYVEHHVKLRCSPATIRSEDSLWKSTLINSRVDASATLRLLRCRLCTIASVRKTASEQRIDQCSTCVASTSMRPRRWATRALTLRSTSTFSLRKHAIGF